MYLITKTIMLLHINSKGRSSCTFCAHFYNEATTVTEISDDDIPFVFKLGRAGVGGLFMDDGVISIIIMYGCMTNT